MYTETMTDWRMDIPETRRRWLRLWFWAVAAMTLAVLVVGGVTRLTHSGLSIVDWDPIMGVVPPLSDGDWQRTFERYQQFPEYQTLREGMSLSEFKVIFFWEYLHRLLARTIGIVFLIPFIFFLARGWLNRPLALRALALFALGGMQGLIGWLMVASGLVDRPSVSHFRLAAHLGLAFLIFGYAVWLIRELSITNERVATDMRRWRILKRSVVAIGALLGLQIIWGAFVAGLKAGFFANTFPKMAGVWIPSTLFEGNFLSNPVAVQWTHRVLGTALALAVIGIVVWMARVRIDQMSRRFGTALLVLVIVQYLLGVITLLRVVPVALGVSHQATALLLFGVWVAWLHHTLRVGKLSGGPGSH